MYNKKLVCAIKVGGRVLREQYRDGNSVVYLPFGAEYSLLLKNLSTQKSIVNVEIDGKNVTDGGMIVDANVEVNFERAINGNMVNGRKFKFIEKTEEISDFRGDRVDDGLIRITYQFEKQYFPAFTVPSWPNQWIGHGHDVTYGPVTNLRGSASGGGGTQSSSCFLNSSGATYSAKNDATPVGAINSCCLGDASGITVEGSRSNQTFTYGSIGSLECEVHTMVFQLIPGSGTVNFFTTDRKLQCPSCGRKWKNNLEFCGRCGTALRK